MDQYYYVFGFLLLVYIILAITCAEITTVLCYFQLCSEVRSTCYVSKKLLSSSSSSKYISVGLPLVVEKCVDLWIHRSVCVPLQVSSLSVVES